MAENKLFGTDVERSSFEETAATRICGGRALPPRSGAGGAEIVCSAPASPSPARASPSIVRSA